MAQDDEERGNASLEDDEERGSTAQRSLVRKYSSRMAGKNVLRMTASFVTLSGAKSLCFNYPSLYRIIV